MVPVLLLFCQGFANAVLAYEYLSDGFAASLALRESVWVTSLIS